MNKKNFLERKNFPLTIDQLIEAALLAKMNYGGDKYVLISDDEEGNGYHECYFAFSEGKETLDGVNYPFDLSPEQCVTLG